MKNTKTYYQLIMDRSGSMSDCIQQTISGYNEQIQMLRKLEAKHEDQEIFVSLLMFNQEFKPVYQNLKPSAIKELSLQDFVPNGMTALLDAVGSSVNNLNYRISKEVERDEASAVVVILTDGYENASKEYNLHGIANLIKRLEGTDKWTFTYLGATLDAVEIAVSLNISRANACAYAKMDTKEVFADLSDGMADYLYQKSSGRIKKSFIKR